MLSYTAGNEMDKSSNGLCLYVAKEPGYMLKQKSIVKKTYSGIIINIGEDNTPNIQYSANWKQNNLEFRIIGHEYETIENVAKEIIDYQK